MRTFIITILALFLITAGCVSSSTESTPNTGNTTTTPPTTNIPNETTNPGTNENITPVETTPPENTTPPVESTPPANTPTTFTLTDISTHNQATDCWTTIRGKVYDITDFVNGHPGGPGILAACGIDGTTLFTTRNGNGPHPASAAKTIEEYYIGELTS